MRRISVYSISLVCILCGAIDQLNAQDTIIYPLKIKGGLEVSGPALYFSDKNILNGEGYISADLNEKYSLVFAGGYLNYKYSQYNYDYRNKGIFMRTGVDINILKPEKSLGKYWGGIGLRYGISRYNSEIPSFKKTNYWGTKTSMVGSRTYWSHFLEVSPGFRAEIFKNFSIGWAISLRMMLYSSTGNDLRPLYLPGFGNGTSKVSTGISYFMVLNIPYKKINVITKKEEIDESDDTSQPVINQQTNQGRQQTLRPDNR
jgi:hypothetical protein